jgi:PAS domain-containing protein
LRRAKHELEMIQNVVENTPFPVWQIADSGNVVMSNAAFRELGSDLGKQLIHFATSNNIHVERVKFEVEKNKPPHWFDINKFSLPKSSVQYALDVTEIVRAQQAQKNFVQTLTKTFATLSISLAIFDRNRQLMLFNPALIDLTTLPADFLSARPNLLTVFDKLRDNQIMPEPKKLCDLEGKACHFGSGSDRGDLH